MNLNFIKGKPCKQTEGNWKILSSALITNEPKVKSEDVVEEEAEPHSVVEKEGNEEEEFYTLEELDDLRK